MTYMVACGCFWRTSSRDEGDALFHMGNTLSHYNLELVNDTALNGTLSFEWYRVKYRCYYEECHFTKTKIPLQAVKAMLAVLLLPAFYKGTHYDTWYENDTAQRGVSQRCEAKMSYNI